MCACVCSLGGGLYVLLDAVALLNNSVLTNNNASNDGGGLYSTAGANSTHIGCTYTSNRAGSNGGAVSVGTGGRHRFERCAFLQNAAVGWGGAVLVAEGAQATLDACVFLDNTADRGAAVFLNTSVNTSASLVRVENDVEVSCNVASINAFNDSGAIACSALSAQLQFAPGSRLSLCSNTPQYFPDMLGACTGHVDPVNVVQCGETVSATPPALLSSTSAVVVIEYDFTLGNTMNTNISTIRVEGVAYTYTYIYTRHRSSP